MAKKSTTAAQAAPSSSGRASAKKRIRKIFGDIHEVVQMPNLIEVQRESYEQFLRSDPATGYVSGLEKTLRSVFPIRDFAGTSELDFVHYELEDPKYDTTECRQRGITYAAPMKVTLRLIVFEVDAETETRSVLDIKEQDVYMGDMPLMTENGTFIINGTERVIVSHPLLWQVPVRRAGHSLSRFVARFRVRRQGHRQRPHRPQAQAAGHRAAPCAGPRQRADPRSLLRHGHLAAR
jgi:DNA-directed RNA polymerase subunit beta